MKLNSISQLGLKIGEDDDLKESIFQRQVEVIKSRGYDSDRVLEHGIKNCRELIHNDGVYQNENYLIKNAAMKMVREIPVKNSKFDIKFLKNLPHKKATFLLGDSLAIKYYKTPSDVYGIFYTYDKVPEGIMLNWRWFRVDLSSGKIKLPKKNVDNKDISVHDNDPYNDDEFILFVKLLLFVELSELELEFLAPNQKTGTRKQGKYFNKSDSNVFIVNSKWNVVSINNDGFKVRGHWRMQPYGSNRLKRKMIWIDTFEKEGYIRNNKQKQKVQL